MKGPGKGIGVTMALLGVMLAFCAAMVGAARTDLVLATIAQSNLYRTFQAQATKYRVMNADAEMLHAVTPSKQELAKFEGRLAAVRAKSGRGDAEDAAEIKDAVNVSTRELADLVSPDKEDEDRLSSLAKKYEHEMAEAKEDAEAYDLVIEAHHMRAEGYERGQLSAEIGIVVASIALLLASRRVWMVSVAIGALGLAFVAKTAISSHTLLAAAEDKIKNAAAHTAELGKGDEAPVEQPASSSAP